MGLQLLGLLGENMSEREVIATGNEELDLKLGGGVPHPALILIEGEHGTGKTAIASQFVYGYLKTRLKVLVFTTELTIKEFLNSMKELQLDVTKPFIEGYLRIYSIQLAGIKWIQRYSSLLLPLVGAYLSTYENAYDVAIIDSLTHLCIYALPSSVLNFITKTRILTSKGKSIIMTLHPKSIREDLAVRLRAACDGYIVLRNEAFGGRVIKIMSIIKMRGLPPGAETSLSFDIDPAFGIKIIPIKVAKA